MCNYSQRDRLHIMMMIVECLPKSSSASLILTVASKERQGSCQSKFHGINSHHKEDYIRQGDYSLSNNFVCQLSPVPLGIGAQIPQAGKQLISCAGS